MATSRKRKRSRIPVALYVPNILGYIRIILAFIGLGLAVVFEDVDDGGANNGATNNAVVVITCWIAAAILDLLDGIIARKLNQTSQFGVLLDIIADNILRTCSWIAVVISSSISKPSTSPSSSSSLVTVIRILIATMIICVEWLTMVATQVHSSSNGGKNWKDTRDNDHWLIKQFFHNNFRNPLGILGIYGLFSASLFCYGYKHKVMYDSIPYFEFWMYTAYVGRGISACIEVHFCLSYAKYVLSKDEQQQQQQQEANSNTNENKQA